MKVVQKKVCLLGDFAVGKTSLVRRFVEGRFEDKYLSTIGVKVARKSLEREDSKLNLLVWDLVGGNEFSRAETGYLLGTAGALVVCDLTRPDTLEAMKRYTNQVRAVNPTVAVIFLGNKVDLTEERAITAETLTAVTTELNAPILLTSAKTGENVETAFELLANLIEGESA
jgi:small GTP-binding protein